MIKIQRLSYSADAGISGLSDSAGWESKFFLTVLILISQSADQSRDF